jgi:membrane carboxypeptidase/penicillin-binding protein
MEQKMDENTEPLRILLRVTLLFVGFLAVILLPVIGYYANEVRVARNDTPAIVAAAQKRFGSELQLEHLTPDHKTILLAVEDPTFMHHHGVDLATPGAGMTTITQGLVKLLYFPDGFHQGIAKIRQTLIAQYALDSLVSKDRQLTLYLNMCYLGTEQNQGIFGYANGARIYFHKEFTELTDEEFLSLLAMTISPNTLKPGSAANLVRVQRIRDYMSGKVRPASVLDVEYNGKPNGTLAEEALMFLLRVVTKAGPD